MHELSIAEALFDIARSHVPAGASLRKVTMRAGPLQAIDPDAMRLAWRALAGEGVGLDLDLPAAANAGNDDELYLTSIEIDEEPCHASSSGREGPEAER